MEVTSYNLRTFFLEVNSLDFSACTKYPDLGGARQEPRKTLNKQTVQEQVRYKEISTGSRERTHLDCLSNIIKGPLKKRIFWRAKFCHFTRSRPEQSNGQTATGLHKNLHTKQEILCTEKCKI